MTWRHVHILFDTCFAYQYRSLSLIQIEESLNRACRPHFKIMWVACPRHWQGMLHGAHSMVSGRDTVPNPFRAAILAKMGFTGDGIPVAQLPLRHLAKLRLQVFPQPGTWRVCYLQCFVVLLRVVRCELQHVFFPVSAGWEHSCHPCDHGVGAGVPWIKTAKGFCHLYILKYIGLIWLKWFKLPLYKYAEVPEK